MAPEYKVNVPEEESLRFEWFIEKHLPKSTILAKKKVGDEIETSNIIGTWKEELNALENMTIKAKEAIANKDSVVFDNFKLLQQDALALIPLPSLVLKYPPSMTHKFADDVINVFKTSIKHYRNLPERPVYVVKKGKSLSVYYKKPYHDRRLLTPRQIRLVVYRYGLSGDEKTDDELREIEKIKDISPSVRLAVSNLAQNFREE